MRPAFLLEDPLKGTMRAEEALARSCGPSRCPGFTEFSTPKYSVSGSLAGSFQNFLPGLRATAPLRGSLGFFRGLQGCPNYGLLFRITAYSQLPGLSPMHHLPRVTWNPIFGRGRLRWEDLKFEAYAYLYFLIHHLNQQ